MASYVPPLRDIRFVLEQLIDLDGLSKLEAFCHADPDTVFGVIEESGRFMADVVGPLNQVGDTSGNTLDGDDLVSGCRPRTHRSRWSIASCSTWDLVLAPCSTATK